MRLTTTTNVSVDGVMQGLGGPDEDRSGGFVRGGWAIPLLDTETGDYLNQVYAGAAAFLFGRRTYEIFAGSWGAMADPSSSPIAAALNSRPKYVASTSLADPQWAGTTVLHGDVARAVADLKAHQDGTLLVPGSGALVRWLLANDLIAWRSTSDDLSSSGQPGAPDRRARSGGRLPRTPGSARACEHGARTRHRSSCRSRHRIAATAS